VTAALLLAAALAGAWVLADLVHSRVVAARLRRWEASVERGEDGVQAGKAAFEVGTGDTALLLVHGIDDSPRVFRKMAPLLAELGFTCRAMRLPGFAEPVEAAARATREDWIHAVGRELDGLRRTRKRVAVVAHSLGAAVAIAHVTDHPESADAVVLLAPLIRVSGRRSPLLSARAWHRVAGRALRFTRVTETPFRIDARDPAERDYPGRVRFTPRPLFDQLFLLIDRIRGRAPDLAAPLLMVLARHDRVVDNRAAERFFRDAGSRVKELRCAEDAGHAVPVDHGWERVTRDIAEFLRGR
jgi:carboxylesterase